MIYKKSRTEAREKRHYKMRNYLSGTSEQPRLAVYRSNKHIYAQVIDDTAGHTLVSASTMDKSLVESDKLKSTSNIEAAKAVGKAIAKKAVDKGIETVVFDRGGYIYHGKVQALAEAARENGLRF
ncbi:MAG: 50S ribosomal protein L18 [Clostridiales bacterium]|jgi:large subunit ribosomal protein L18|nr:50S ribosomal protein L18 [Clostridiales bacterium]